MNLYELTIRKALERPLVECRRDHDGQNPHDCDGCGEPLAEPPGEVCEPLAQAVLDALAVKCRREYWVWDDPDELRAFVERRRQEGHKGSLSDSPKRPVPASPEHVHDRPFSGHGLYGCRCAEIIEHPETCDCHGTGYVPRTVDLNDRVSVAEACGRLMLLVLMDMDAIAVDDQTDGGWANCWLACERGDYTAARDALGRLLEKLWGVEVEA